LILDLRYLEISQTKKLNEISEKLKLNFHDLIENIYKNGNNSIAWITSSVLSRNNYLSTIYSNLCYIELIKFLIKKNNITKIIVLNKAQKKVAKNYLNKINLNIRVVNSENILFRIKYYFSPGYHFYLNLITMIKRLLIKDFKRIEPIVKNKKIILIDTFFLPSMFVNEKFDDRYYPGLLDFFPLNKDKLFFVPTLLIEKDLKKIIKLAENSVENFLYKFDFLSLKDYLFALFNPLTMKSKTLNDLSFKGLDVSDVFKHDLYINRFNDSSFKGLLNYRFFKSLKKNGVALELVINWFENQVIDRGFNKGKTQYYPNVKSIGYQGFIVPYEYNYHIQPTEVEYRMGLTPNCIAPIGSSLIPEVSKYCKNLPTIVGPAFRFNGVYNDKRNDSNESSKNNSILIALPISVPESLDILRLAIESMSDKSLNKINWLVKPHPSLDLEKIESSFPSLFKNFLLLEGSFDEAIARVKLMVGNASSTSMEGLAHGIPVIIVGSKNGFFQNPIPHSVPKDIWSFCITKDEFIGSVNRLLYNSNSLQTPDLKVIGEKIRGNYFEPVNHETVSAFFNLNQTN